MSGRIRLEDLPPRYREQVKARLRGGVDSVPLDTLPQAALDEAARPPAGMEVRRKPAGWKAPTMTEVDFLRNVLGGAGYYEALTFRLPGGSRYTPDWVVWGPDGRITCYEVKGAYRLPSQGRALTAWRECRAAFPAVRFRWFERVENGGFEERYADGT